jgi:hypothetical protein
VLIPAACSILVWFTFIAPAYSINVWTTSIPAACSILVWFTFIAPAYSINAWTKLIPADCSINFSMTFTATTGISKIVSRLAMLQKCFVFSSDAFLFAWK